MWQKEEAKKQLYEQKNWEAEGDEGELAPHVVVPIGFTNNSVGHTKRRKSQVNPCNTVRHSISKEVILENNSNGGEEGGMGGTTLMQRKKGTAATAMAIHSSANVQQLGDYHNRKWQLLSQRNQVDHYHGHQHHNQSSRYENEGGNGNGNTAMSPTTMASTTTGSLKNNKILCPTMAQSTLKPFLKRSLKTPMVKSNTGMQGAGGYQPEIPRHSIPVHKNVSGGAVMKSQLGNHFIVEKSRQRKSELNQIEQHLHSIQPIIPPSGQSQSHSMLRGGPACYQSPQTRTFNELGFPRTSSIREESLSDLRQQNPVLKAGGNGGGGNQTTMLFSERQHNHSKVLKSTSLDKNTGNVKTSMMQTTATSINYGSIKQSPFLSSGLPPAPPKAKIIGGNGNCIGNSTRLHTADLSPRMANKQPNALMSFLADILGEPQTSGNQPQMSTNMDTDNMKLPKQPKVSSSSNAPVIRQLPNQYYYKGIIQTSSKRSKGGQQAQSNSPPLQTGIGARPLNKSQRRPVSPEEEIDQMLSSRRRAMISPPFSSSSNSNNKKQQMMMYQGGGDIQILNLDSKKRAAVANGILTNEIVAEEETAEELEERFQKECEDLLGSINSPEPQLHSNGKFNLLQQDAIDETDTVYNNNNSREQLLGGENGAVNKGGLNVDLIEVSRDIASRKPMQYNVDTVNKMNATWNSKAAAQQETQESATHHGEQQQWVSSGAFSPITHLMKQSQIISQQNIIDSGGAPKTTGKLHSGIQAHHHYQKHRHHRHSNNQTLTRFMNNRLLQLQQQHHHLNQNSKVMAPKPPSQLQNDQQSLLEPQATKSLQQPVSGIGTFNISVTSISKNHKQGKDSKTVSCTLGSPSKAIMHSSLKSPKHQATTTSTQLKSFYQQHQQLLKNQLKQANKIVVDHHQLTGATTMIVDTPLLISAPSISLQQDDD